MTRRRVARECHASINHPRKAPGKSGQKPADGQCDGAPDVGEPAAVHAPGGAGAVGQVCGVGVQAESLIAPASAVILTTVSRIPSESKATRAVPPASHSVISFLSRSAHSADIGCGNSSTRRSSVSSNSTLAGASSKVCVAFPRSAAHASDSRPIVTSSFSWIHAAPLPTCHLSRACSARVSIRAARSDARTCQGAFGAVL